MRDESDTMRRGSAEDRKTLESSIRVQGKIEVAVPSPAYGIVCTWVFLSTPSRSTAEAD